MNDDDKPTYCVIGKDCSKKFRMCWICGISLCYRHYGKHTCISCDICNEPMLETSKSYKTMTFFAACKNGHKIKGKLTNNRYNKSINMNFVKLAKEFVSIDNFITRTSKDMGDSYILKDIMVTGNSQPDEPEKGAIYCIYPKLLELTGFWYPIRFTIPKSNVIDHETQEFNEEQNIEIKEWAYKNCYIRALNEILENYGKYMHFLAINYDTILTNPMYRGHRGTERLKMITKKKKELEEKVNDFVEDNKEYKSEMRETIIELKKRRGGNLLNDEPKKEIKKKILFYTDGSGNLANDKKTRDNGHYSVYCRSREGCECFRKEECKGQWKHYEERLTSNQAEIKGVIAALIIAKQKGYDPIEIRTDSQLITNWLSGAWNIKSENLVDLVERLRNGIDTFDKIEINWIKRDRNYAHGV